MHHDAKPDLVKPLLISTFIIAGVAVAGGLLAFSAGTRRPVQTVIAEPAGTVKLPPNEARMVRGPTPGIEHLVKRRLTFANHLEKRYRARELPVEVKVTGEDQRVFTFRWTLPPNPDQLRLMKHAEPLWEELQGLGFRRVEMMDPQATKLLWYKDF